MVAALPRVAADGEDAGRSWSTTSARPATASRSTTLSTTTRTAAALTTAAETTAAAACSLSTTTGSTTPWRATLRAALTAAAWTAKATLSAASSTATGSTAAAFAPSTTLAAAALSFTATTLSAAASTTAVGRCSHRHSHARRGSIARGGRLLTRGIPDFAGRLGGTCLFFFLDRVRHLRVTDPARQLKAAWPASVLRIAFDEQRHLQHALIHLWLNIAHGTQA